MQRKKMQWSMFFLMIGLSFLLVSCNQDERMKKLQKFITVQLDCETYKKANGDKQKLKETFSEFFTEESYQKYLDDVVGYFYPQFYYMTSADQVDIKSIICKKVKEEENKLRTYTFEVAYKVIPLKVKGEAHEPISIKDQIQITIDENNQIVEVIFLNTSDIIAKLFLDIKVQ